jgi:hypothetical protein
MMPQKTDARPLPIIYDAPKERDEIYINIITFQKTKEVCMGFATQ